MSKRSYKNADYRNTLETIPYRSGEINDFRTARFGLIDKADVQNENPDWPAKKNISCTDIASHGIDTHDYGILTEPMQANMVFTVEPEFIFLPKDSDSSRR
jgi:Xaa-Pro aminopeptidase